MVGAASDKEVLLVAVDNSEASLKLAEFVGKHFPKGFKVNVVHVQCQESYPVAGGSSAAAFSAETQDAINEDQENETIQFLQDVVLPKFAAAGIDATPKVLRVRGSGNSVIGEAICKHADQLKPTFVILTKHSKSALATFFVGSVTKYCLAHIRQPVLVI